MRRETNDEMRRQLAAHLRARARARGLLLTDIPDLAGVSRTVFWDVLAGRRSPTLGWLARVAAVLQ